MTRKKGRWKKGDKFENLKTRIPRTPDGHDAQNRTPGSAPKQYNGKVKETKLTNTILTLTLEETPYELSKKKGTLLFIARGNG